MTRRVCGEPGCGRLIDPGTRSGRCTIHRAKRRAERWRDHDSIVYDRKHIAERKVWQRRLDAGEVIRCWRPDCDRVIDPNDWQLGHREGLRSAPECPACNLHAAGRAAHGLPPNPNRLR